MWQNQNKARVETFVSNARARRASEALKFSASALFVLFAVGLFLKHISQA